MGILIGIGNCVGARAVAKVEPGEVFEFVSGAAFNYAEKGTGTIATIQTSIEEGVTFSLKSETSPAPAPTNISIVPDTAEVNPVTWYYKVVQINISWQRCALSAEHSYIQGDDTTELIFGCDHVDRGEMDFFLIMKGTTTGIYTNVLLASFVPPSTAIPVADAQLPFNLLTGVDVPMGAEIIEAQIAALSEIVLADDDSTLFAIDPENGELTFLASPDYEVPQDQNSDNIYDCTVRATYGENTIEQIIHVTVTNIIEAEILEQSATDIFKLAHGTCQKGNSIYLGTHTYPAQIVCFPNPGDLTEYTSVVLEELFGDIENLVYDDVNDRIYATVLTGPISNMCIISINPADISDYSVVVNSESEQMLAFNSLSTDGTYVYVGSGRTVYKYRISDWTLVSSVEISEMAFHIHSSQLYKYNDRTELYITNLSSNSCFAKINCADMTYSYVAIPEISHCPDDFALKYIDNDGCYAYLGAEYSDSIVRVNTKLMTYELFASKKSYGIFVFGDDIWNCTKNESPWNGVLIQYPGGILNNPVEIHLPQYDIPNELFSVSTGALLYTHWDQDIGKLVRYQIEGS